jgi:subtilisin-like proprotein convertase family protein
MMRRIVFVFVALLVGGSAWADVPPLLPTQGVLLDSAGLPVTDGSYYVTFSLYAAPSGGTALWSEAWPPEGTGCEVAGACVAVEGGAFSVLLGSHTPLDPAVFAAAPELWLGMKVESDPELPRRRVASSAYAFQAARAVTAASAQGLACTGCIWSDSLGFPVASADAAGAALHALLADEASDLACSGCVDAADVGFAWAASAGLAGGAAADLECSGCVSLAELDPAAVAALSDAYTDAKALAAVAASGYMKKTDPVTPAQLPATGLDEVSNGVLTTQFLESQVVDTPVAIPDFAPPYPSATASLTLPDGAIAESFSVQVAINHANVGQLQVTLIAPSGQEYLLHNKTDGGQTTLYTSYPDPTPPATGDLNDVLGTNVAGTWVLQVKDTVAGGTGTLDQFWIHLGYLSGSAAKVDGDLEVAGALTVGGKDVVQGWVLDCYSKQQYTDGPPVPPLSIECNSGYTLSFAWIKQSVYLNVLTECIGKSVCSFPTPAPSTYYGGSCCKPVLK